MAEALWQLVADPRLQEVLRRVEERFAKLENRNNDLEVQLTEVKKQMKN